MYCIEAKAKIDIPLGSEEDNYHSWGNSRLVQYIISHRGRCKEFDEALQWIEGRTYQQAMNDCTKSSWKEWLKKNLSNKSYELIKAGEIVTITNGRNEKYALWHGTGIWDLPTEYVGETVRIISKD